MAGQVGPTAWLNRHVLGIEVISNQKVRVVPNLGDLEWAEGAIPMAGGLVKVRIEKGKEPLIEVPEGVELVRARRFQNSSE